MNKILFIMKYPTCLDENLKRKFNGQMNACIHLGYEVWFIEWNGKYFFLKCKNTNERKMAFRKKSILKKEFYYHTQIFMDLYQICFYVLKREKFDYIYMRSMPSLQPALKMVKEIAENSKLIIEIPTYPIENEYSKEKRWIRKFCFKILDHNKKIILSRANLLTLCGEEAEGTAYGRPAINFSNGIDVEHIPIREPDLDNKKIHILLLASMCYWQAYDKIIESLASYNKKENVILHFVGDDGDGSLKKWKTLVEESGLTKNVIFHGALYGENLNRIVNISDIGVGTLGLYRKNLEGASTLKIREYMSRGLPFVYAGEDPAVSEDCPYVLKVPNDKTSLNMSEIIEFAEQLKNCTDIPYQMREYAKRNMSWTKEFSSILEKVKCL